MDPFAGNPKCPTCGKNVYAAEQVIGPGRRIYHKPCLKCFSCSRRLDSLSLLEHNQEPYCKPCHIKNFGTRDLRSANVGSSTPSLSSTRSSPRVAQSAQPVTRADSLPSTSTTISEEPLDEAVESLTLADPTEDVTQPSNDKDTEITKLSRATSLPPSTYNGDKNRPLSPTATGTSTSSTPPYLRRSMTGSGPDASGALKPSYTGNLNKKTFGTGFGGAPSCPRCGKAVYFAEQVKASGRTWHKPCLRCNECSVLLDSTRITEKDGVVMCRSCYSKLHGPQGSGYALLGRAG